MPDLGHISSLKRRENPARQAVQTPFWGVCGVDGRYLHPQGVYPIIQHAVAQEKSSLRTKRRRHFSGFCGRSDKARPERAEKELTAV